MINFNMERMKEDGRMMKAILSFPKKFIINYLDEEINWEKKKILSNNTNFSQFLFNYLLIKLIILFNSQQTKFIKI